MKEYTTPSILQRVPVVLAVTAASYGLPTQAQGQRSNGGMGHAVSSTASPSPLERSAREVASSHH
ncbi:MAG TPA: hypothetical protein VNS31_05970 [Ramlibacter sp.]|jgi:hypothetical protein|nr:hypothetical protein [Ramlibacter sp.]